MGVFREEAVQISRSEQNGCSNSLNVRREMRHGEMRHEEMQGGGERFARGLLSFHKGWCSMHKYC